MTKVVGDNYPRSINQYTPNMEFAADVVDGVHIANLGSPAALDDDGIFDGVTVGTAGGDIHTSSDYETTFDGSSTSLTTTPGMIDATYGRCLVATGNASTDQVCTIIGRDYLGQPMRENFTLSGTTRILGNKAFKFVDSTSCTAGTGGSTLDLGWTDELGLPYKAEALLSVTQDDVDFPTDTVDLSWDMASAGLAAGSSVFVVSPIIGFVKSMMGVQQLLTLGSAVATLENAGTAVAGLTFTLSSADGLGGAASDTPTDIADLTGLVAQFAALEVVFGSAATAGYASGSVTVTPQHFTAGIDTDPQTLTTGDPRGTILFPTACDGSITFEVRYSVDTSDLHGVEHFNT